MTSMSLSVSTSRPSSPFSGEVFDHCVQSESLECPISHEIMQNPVMDQCGHTFDQSTVEALQKAAAAAGRTLKCPITNLEIKPIFFPNLALKAIIESSVKYSPSHREKRAEDLMAKMNDTLTSVCGELTAVRTKLDSVSGQLTLVKEELESTKEELTSVNDTLTFVEERLNIRETQAMNIASIAWYHRIGMVFWIYSPTGLMNSGISQERLDLLTQKPKERKPRVLALLPPTSQDLVLQKPEREEHKEFKAESKRS